MNNDPNMTRVHIVGVLLLVITIAAVAFFSTDDDGFVPEGREAITSVEVTP